MSSKSISKIFKSREFTIFLILLFVTVIIGIRRPAFFSFSTLFDVMRSSLVFCVMGFGVLMVLVSGGVDISFVAIAAMSSYSTHMLLIKLGYKGDIGLYFVIAMFMGLLAGVVLGVIITQFKLPVFFVSLGYMSLWYGFNLFFIGATMNFQIPDGMVGYYSRFLIKVRDPVVGEAGLHISIIYLVVITVLIWWGLKYTTFGRGLYAIGGNREVAIRTGFNVKLITIVMLALVGILAAFAGVTESAYSRFFNPVLFLGRELDVLAAVIIGGASIKGGRGTVLGTILGVVLIEIINRGLIFLGIPAEWQRMVIGIVLIIFISIPAITEQRARKLKYVSVSE